MKRIARKSNLVRKLKGISRIRLIKEPTVAQKLAAARRVRGIWADKDPSFFKEEFGA